jgi:NADH pyrophosphatase NudC (nudix superfamily)
MVKVPLKAKVEIDLWDAKKKSGLVKYYTTTMYLVRAKSDFDLKKGDQAIVIESKVNLVKVVPEKEYIKKPKSNFLKIKQKKIPQKPNKEGKKIVKKCASCGTQQEGTEDFCAYCGSKQNFF